MTCAIRNRASHDRKIQSYLFFKNLMLIVISVLFLSIIIAHTVFIFSPANSGFAHITERTEYNFRVNFFFPHRTVCDYSSIPNSIPFPTSPPNKTLIVTGQDV
jgi:hypothetical protein